MSEASSNPLEPMPGGPSKTRGDLAVRTASAIVMIGLAGGAFWAGGWALNIFIGLVVFGLLWEFWGLVQRIATGVASRSAWLGFGVIYFGIAAFTLLALSSPLFGKAPALMVLGSVVATDIGAYFAGRTIGGPKIAPSISPSKTWAGLFGGALASSAFFTWCTLAYRTPGDLVPAGLPFQAVGAGIVIAVVAQSGDFFESWMKRRAGVKDSGSLIPGHGGLFDRTDGMIAVLFATGLLFFGAAMTGR